MIDNELLNKFDRIEDLPISEEILGAYLEGNLSESEIEDVDLMIKYQPNVTELFDELSQSCEINTPFHEDSWLSEDSSELSFSEVVGGFCDLILPDLELSNMCDDSPICNTEIFNDIQIDDLNYNPDNIDLN